MNKFAELVAGCSNISRYSLRRGCYNRDSVFDEDGNVIGFPGGNMIEADPNGRFATNSYLLQGDYANVGMVGVANMKDFEELFGESAGTWFDVISESYGGRLVVLDLENAEFPEAAAELICSLENYPLINDETHSDLEYEDQNLQFDQYGRDDLLKEVRINFDLEEEDFDNVPEETIAEVFWATCSEVGRFPEGSLNNIRFPWKDDAEFIGAFFENIKPSLDKVS